MRITKAPKASHACVAIVLGAGSGTRLGADCPKAFVELGGRPLIEWSLEVFVDVPLIDRIVAALPQQQPDLSGTVLSQAQRFDLSDFPSVTCVEGGATRSQSVINALVACGDADRIVIHDAARPFVTVELIETTLAALAESDAAIAAAPVTDTIKQADTERRVTTTLDRSKLWAIQTPQAFRRDALEAGLSLDPELVAHVTDEAMLLEQVGKHVTIIESTPDNFKITTAFDLRMAEQLIRSAASEVLTGI